MRCFLAIELPDSVRSRLAGLQKELSGLDRLVRWTRVEQIHLTLKFLGEVPEVQIAQVCETVRHTTAGLPSFQLDIAGTGCFPTSGLPRILWVGVVGPPPALLTAQQVVEEALTEVGYLPEGRAYKPHLTLARTRDRIDAREIRPAMKTVESFSGGSFAVPELVLFQSILGPNGATHVPLMRAELSGG